MSSRLTRAWRGMSLACLWLVAVLGTAPALAQVQVAEEGVAPPGSTGAVAVAAGWHHSCALQADSTAVCWGNNDFGQSTPPPGQHFSALSAGWFDTCGVRDDGGLQCWGERPELQQVPPGAFTRVAIADNGTACALRLDGSVSCWGVNYTAPQPVGSYLALSAASDLACGLRSDRGIDCWSADTSVWGGIPGGPYRALAVGGAQVCGLTDTGDVVCWDPHNNTQTAFHPGPFQALTASVGGACALDAQGLAQCWGYGQFTQQVPMESFTTVILGSDQACAIRPSGSVACWGGNFFGEASPPPGAAAVEVVAEGEVSGGGRIRTLTSGEFHTCALLDDHSVSCWGNNDMGQSQPPPMMRFTQISAAGFGTCGVNESGEVICWGEPLNGYAGPGPFVSVARGPHHACALRADGTVACWGDSNWQPNGRYLLLAADIDRTCGLRYDGSVECWAPWGDPDVLPGGPYVSLSMSMGQRCGVEQAGNVRCFDLMSPNEREGRSAPWPFTAVSATSQAACGLQSNGQLDCWGATYGWSPRPAGTYLALSAGYDHVCGVRGNGAVTCWGSDNYFGQLTPPRALSTPPSIAAGYLHTCAVRTDGAVDCWGDNTKGQSAPPPGTFVAVGAGDAHSCGLGEDGIIRCWGNNNDGQLDAPLQPMAQMSIGPSHGCALDEQGNPQCWGWNGYGQTAPPPGLQFDSISAGFAHSCGVLRGAPQGLCWGYNGDGQTNVPMLPWEVSWLSIQAGAQHSCGLASDGFIHCWGSDSDGQSGQPPTGYFRALSVGQYHNCAIRTDGRLACWGANWAGQTDAPQGTFISVSAGTSHTCAVATDGSRQCWGKNADGQAPRRTLFPDQFNWAIAYGQPFYAQVTLFDGDVYGGQPVPAQFSLSAGQLPPGLNLASNGEISGTPSAGGRFAFTLSGVDAMGFGASRDYEVLIDNTPPTVTAFYSWPNSQFNGWYTSNVEVSWQIQDDESSAWPESGCVRTLFNTDTTGTSISCTARSAGGATTQVVTIKRDATPPETVFTVTPPALTNRTDAQFAFSGSDATSGVNRFECSLDGAPFATCTSPQSFLVNAAGGAHTFQVRAVDNAGLRDTTPASYSWTVDTTPPVVTPTITGAQGNNGWYVGDVQIAWAVSDAESPIVSATGCNTVSVTSDTLGAGFTCTVVNAAGATTTRTVNIKRDATPPQVTAAATSAANGAGWYKADVGVGFACADALSGVVACPVAQVLTGEGTRSSTAVSVTDAAGNSAVSNIVTVRIDRTAPTLAPNVTPGTLVLNAVTTANANGADSLSGVASEQCDAVETGSVGSKTVACTVTDAAGNSATASATYSVAYAFGGFTAPVQNLPVLNVIKANRSIPLRWRVLDAQGAPVTSLGSADVAAIAIGCPSATENKIATYGGSNGQLQNLGNGYYALDWYASGSLRGLCRRLELDLGDGQVHPAQFRFN